MSNFNGGVKEKNASLQKGVVTESLIQIESGEPPRESDICYGGQPGKACARALQKEEIEYAMTLCWRKAGTMENMSSKKENVQK